MNSIEDTTNDLVRTVRKQDLFEFIGLGTIRVNGLRKAVLASRRF